MDDNCANDGIYAGRYVLIEYDSTLSNSDYDKGWYLVTNADNKHIPYSSVSSCVSTNNYYLYFNGPVATTVQTVSSMRTIPTKVIYFEKYRHFTILNKQPLYIKVKSNGAYTPITWEQFIGHYEYQGSELSIEQSTPEELEEQEIVHAHIANGVAHIEDTSLFVTANTEVYAVVLPGAQYTYNLDSEFWTIQDTTFTLDGKEYAYINQIPNDASGNYQTNFNVDRGRYSTARGYDSTVWQKVYSNGVEKYVMIAELNSVVPSFGVSSDPPSLLPISPHFGADSTNVYYELHWQPNWGFRVKAANNNMMLPQVQPNGQLNLLDAGNIQSQYATIYARDKSSDDVYYPSDQLARWQQTFEDNTLDHDERRKTLYFNPSSQKWETDTKNEVPSAIYFNRSGFNSTKIAYSADLISEESRDSYPSWNRYNANVAQSGWKNEDNITLTPTGLSGNVYNLHDGSIDLKSQADTQELSIMLPSIGDTIAQVWDLVYGGRNTTQGIATTNFRNKDIAWEDAKGEPARRGLRLTGIDADEYNKAQVDTIAGAINTAHDLLGMIISSNTTAELADVNNLDENRIYYDSDKHQYFRKHKTYEYTQVPNSIYQFDQQTTSNLNQEKINSGIYYEYDPVSGEYIVATVYDPEKEYFLRVPKPSYNEVVISGKILSNFPYQNYKWYQDYLSENSSIINGMSDSNLQKLRSDYILDGEYKEGRTYYDVTATPVTLSQNYLPDTYWYKTSNNDRLQFMIDTNDVRTKDRNYYLFNTNRLLSLKGDRNFRGVYVPGLYYFQKKNGSFELDLSDYQTCNGLLAEDQVALNPDGTFNYYLLNLIKSYDTTGNEVLYRRTYDYFIVSDLDENTFIQNTYYTYDNATQSYVLVEDYIPGIDYYLRQVTYTKIDDTSQVEISILDTFPSESLVVYHVGTYFLRNTNASGELLGFTELTRADFLNDSSIHNKEVWVFGEKENAVPPFLTLDEAIAANDIIKQQDNFYQENTYHFMRNGSYVLDTSLTLTEGRQYYTIQVEEAPSNLIYYEPGKYYVESPSEYGFELANDLVIDTDTTHLYVKDDYYVINDTKHILPYGTQWNPNAAAVPAEITLGTRKEKWELQALTGFSKNMGTLNGMILKMYQMIEPYDTLTRDSDNVSGTINQVKDVIARFNDMKSRESMIVDNYGRARSAPIATGQYTSFNQVKTTSGDIFNSITKDRFAETDSVANMQRKWITVNIDGDPNNPVITIHHNFQPVTNTVSWLNKNGDTTTQASLSTIATDNITLYTPIVDGMGHVVGNNTQTVTLPYGFKTFTIANEDTDNAGAATTAGSGGSIVADNTQDTFTFKTVDKWLRFVTDATNDTLTIAHKLHTMTAEQSAARASNLNTDEVASNLDSDKLVLHDIVWDAAAHMLEDHPHTWTLPYGFKTFTISNEDTDDTSAYTTPGSGGSIVAENTQDTFNFKTANKWLRFVTDPNTDTLTIAHKQHTMTATQSAAATPTNLNADNVASNSDNDKITLHDIVWDGAAHMLEDHPHTYTLPYGFKFVTTGSESTAVTDLTSAAVTIAAESTQDTVTFNTANIWMKLSANATDDSVTFGHLVRAITRTAQTTSDLNVAIGATVANNSTTTDSTVIDLANQINIQDIAHDEAGHITSRQDHIYTLPYGFKFITTKGTAGATTANDATGNYTANVHSTNVTSAALNTQDTLTIDPGNGWLKVNVNQNDRKVTLYHYVAAIDKTASTATDFNNVSNGVFSLYDITHDDAGHVTAWKSHQYTLPYGFKTVTHTNNDATTDLDLTNYTSSNHNIVAETVVDTLNIVSQNKWIRLKADEDTDTLTISHLTNNFTPTTSSGSLSSESAGVTFDVVDTYSKDEAGHLTAINTKTLTMPNSFGKVAISTASTNNSVTMTANTTGIEAECTHDTLTFAAGDRWILLSGDATNDKVTIGHAEPDSTYTYDKGQSADASLNYGETFKVVHAKADRYGHIGSLTDYTITLPSISLTEATNTATSNVLTGITLNTTTGAFSYTQKNVSELQLTNFSYNSSSTSSDDLATGITINEALARLQKKIYNETTATTGARDVAISAAIEALDSSLSNSAMGKTLTGITITNGKITSSTFGDISITSSQVSDLSTTLSTTLSGLTHTATGTLGAGNTITALTQSNGKISYTVSAISITSSQVSDLGTTISNAIDNLDVNNTIGTNEVHLMKTLSEANGKISYTSEKLAWSHISALLPTGNNAFLTVGTAASTYQPKQDDSDPYIKSSDLTDNVYTDTTFLFTEAEGETPEERKTIDELITYIKSLESRIADLENES